MDTSKKLGYLVGIFAGFAINVTIVWFCWNNVLVNLFAFKALTFPQAMLIKLAAESLFSGLAVRTSPNTSPYGD
jgi:hypothetical protein